MNTSKSRAPLLFAAGAVALGLASPIPVFAADTPGAGGRCAPPCAPGSFCAIWAYRMPGRYGPALPAPPGSQRHYPMPGSFEAVMSVKLPARFGPRTSVKNSVGRCPAARYTPGSFRAIVSVKLPMYYRPKRCVLAELS